MTKQKGLQRVRIVVLNATSNAWWPSVEHSMTTHVLWVQKSATTSEPSLVGPSSLPNRTIVHGWGMNAFRRQSRIRVEAPVANSWPADEGSSSIVGTIAIGALALFVFGIPTENRVSIPGIGSLSRLIGVVAFGLAVVSLFGRGSMRFRTPSLFLLIAAAFVTWSAVTVF